MSLVSNKNTHCQHYREAENLKDFLKTTGLCLGNYYTSTRLFLYSFEYIFYTELIYDNEK